MADLDYDVIICGSGLAGLRAAIEAAGTSPKLRIAVVSKLQVMRSHSVSAVRRPMAASSTLGLMPSRYGWVIFRQITPQRRLPPISVSEP